MSGIVLDLAPNLKCSPAGKLFGFANGIHIVCANYRGYVDEMPIGSDGIGSVLWHPIVPYECPIERH